LFLRLCHFLLYTLLFLLKFAQAQASFARATLRLWLLTLYYKFDQEEMVRDCCACQDPASSASSVKKLDHVALVVNNLVSQTAAPRPRVAKEWCLPQPLLKAGDPELHHQLAKIINFLVLTRVPTVSVFDQEGLLKKYVARIQSQLKKLLEADFRHLDLRFQPSSDQSSLKLSFQLVASSPGAPKNQSHSIHFLSEQEDALPSLLKASKLRSAQLKSSQENLQALGRRQAKIGDYAEYQQVHFGGLRQPDLIMVFNSPRRVLQMPGFPFLERELAEIVECGDVREGCFRAVEFIECIERYAHIEQRWGK